jgi:hypothetical protein
MPATSLPPTPYRVPDLAIAAALDAYISASACSGAVAGPVLGCSPTPEPGGSFDRRALRA